MVRSGFMCYRETGALLLPESMVDGVGKEVQLGDLYSR